LIALLLLRVEGRKIVCDIEREERCTVEIFRLELEAEAVEIP